MFTIVNIAVLVLRKDRSTTSTSGPRPGRRGLGIVLCGFLATPLSGRPPQEFLVAGILLVIGAILWVVNRLYVGRVDVDAEPAGQVLSWPDGQFVRGHTT